MPDVVSAAWVTDPEPSTNEVSHLGSHKEKGENHVQSGHEVSAAVKVHSHSSSGRDANVGAALQQLFYLL